MKKLAVVLGVCAAVVVVGVVVFLATFDADRYRPLVIDQLRKATGRPITLEHLSLAWRGGLAVELRGLALPDDAGSQAEPLIHIESATALVRLVPLLRKDVQVLAIVITHPRIRVARDAHGRINWSGLVVAAAPAAASAKPQAARVGDAAVSFNVASLRIERGRIHWTDASSSPPTELWIKALDVAVENISLQGPVDLELHGALAGEVQNVHLRGQLIPPRDGSAGSLDQLAATLDEVALEQFLPHAPPGHPQLRGRVSLEFSGRAPTLDPALAAQELVGSGQMRLADGIVIRMNILREVFGRLSMIPGLVGRLEERLPQEYQAKLAAQDTVLLPVNATVQVEGGILRFTHLDIGTEDFRLAAAGTAGLDGTIQLGATLRVEPVLSAAIIRSVNELQALANADGELELPIAVQGKAPQIAVLPDLQYVASRVITVKAVDLIGQWLDKQRDGSDQQPEAASPAQPPDDSASPGDGDLLGEFLQRVIKQEAR